MPEDTYHTFQTVSGRHSQPKRRTSLTHPLEIATLPAGDGLGAIAVTFCPGKIQTDGATGSWNRDLATDIRAISDWGATTLVTLIESHEIEALQVRGLEAECQRHGIDWLHLPIPDVSTPTQTFETAWVTVGEGLRSRLRNGFNVLVHCKGGLGRAGTIAAKLLVELGADPEDAIKRVREARPGAIETVEQERHVHGIRPIPERQPSATLDAIRDRALGALVGLAVGDAIGTTVEFRSRGSFDPITDMIGGGPFNLRPGVWTDDTSMALCLADSLIACGGLDERDLLQRFCRWFREGENSVTGRCFDIGNVTATALTHFEQTGDVHAGPTDRMTAGNGSLMRLSPVAVRYWNDSDGLRNAARRQSYTTHGAQEAVDASEAFSAILASAIQGRPLTDVLGASYGHALCNGVQAINQGSWKGKHRDDIQSSGYVLHSLEAALWCIGSSGSFSEAVLKAVNLGDDSDTTAAIVGQLAGAFYGLSGIPERWRKRLAWNDRIEGLADRLFTASLR
ncbi:ADP-ribosylglycohydrolase family protein [Methylobacterium sp. B4]|uniref:ADP-ribosylglycohydrolase family protein n=1 Tax=Methylobacterium sp. B4 TaxID=1938755 RepID=UPI000D75BB27|nr:ADP-ribosylglycohydrolase family protein [Methylobacterium sp. B4]PXW53729.1 ADP-ribosyl-[dinitrogen reductase] hydrolase [Methylobacterium sp. B4]